MKNDQMKAALVSEGEPVLFVPGGASVNWLDVASTPELYSHYYSIAPLAGSDGVKKTGFGEYDPLPKCALCSQKLPLSAGGDSLDRLVI